jgi:MFS family permease
MAMAQLQPADTLRSRTFIGLLIAQFLAAFNDQAIHASSMFFAINQHALTAASAITWMPVLFYAPWALFCTLAGYLADRYSKRSSLVAWKVAEIAITLIALLGFWLGTRGVMAGPFLVLGTVFLMGTHSAFFVPAKYGAMPEILQPHMLSRGNGLLESLSFLAVILGTVCGGLLSSWFRGQEYYIGLILVLLAVLGAVSSLLIRPIPPANPTRPFPPYVFKPLLESIRTLFRSRPVALAVIGIAFFTFIVAFMRATVYMHGESRLPRWEEDKTSVVVGMVALGIGLGSPLVGFLSGGKVELGLVPIGAVGMILTALAGALALEHIEGLIACIALLGFFTGFYIVPLYTLLQHRAPKTSKGDAVATSNFINVTGAMIASLLFAVLVFAAQHTPLAPRLEENDVNKGELAEAPLYEHGRPVKFVIKTDAGQSQHVIEPDEQEGSVRVLEVDEDDFIDILGTGLQEGDRVIESTYERNGVMFHRLRREGAERKPVYDNSGLPRLLFAGAGLMTLFTLMLLLRQMPGLILRTFIWLRVLGRYRLDIEGMHHLPSRGPVLLVTNAGGYEHCLHVLSASDRTTRFLLIPRHDETPLPWPLGFLARRTNLACLPPGEAERADWRSISRRAGEALARQEVVALPLGSHEGQKAVQALFAQLTAEHPVPILPVCYAAAPFSDRIRLRIYILAAPPLPPGSSLEAVQEELQRLGREMQHSVEAGASLSHVGSA